MITIPQSLQTEHKAIHDALAEFFPDGDD